MKERCVIDFQRGIVQDECGTAEMTRLMERLLDCFVQHNGQAVSVDTLIRHIWPPEPDRPLDPAKPTALSFSDDSKKLRDLIYLTKKRFPILSECLSNANHGRYTFTLQEGFQVIQATEELTREEPQPEELPAPENAAVPAAEENPVRAFCALWDRARQSNQKHAPAAGQAVLDFALEHLEMLKLALPVEGSPAVPASQCVSDEGQPPLFLARLRLEQAKYLAEQPISAEDRHLRGLRGLLAAVQQARQAAAIAQAREAAEKIWLQAQGGDEPPVAGLLGAQAQALLARCQAELAKRDSTAPPEDLETCYLRPARKAWADAVEMLARAAEHGADPEAVSALQKDLDTLRTQLGLSGAPSVLRKAPQTHRREPRLVFNTVYDSALPHTQERDRLILTQTMQMAATPGMQILMQLPQLLDNDYITGTLLHDPGFQALCQAEIIVLSSYGSIEDPKDYLLMNLEKEDFRFSASPLLEDQKVRQLLARGLRGDLPFSALGLSGTGGEALERLYEGYRLSSLVFKPTSIRRYHQHLSPPGILHRGPQLELPDMVTRRLDQLMKDDILCPVTGRMERLRELKEIGRRACQAGARTRSSYKTLFRRWTGDLDEELLRLSNQLIDQCYGYSSGYRSTNCILNVAPDTDDLLCIHTRLDQPPVDPAGVMSYAIKFADRKVGQNCLSQRLGFDNILDLALIARQLHEETQDEPLSDRLWQETGIGYTPDASGQPLAGSFCVQYESGDLRHISPGPGAGYRMEFEEGGANCEK